MPHTIWKCALLACKPFALQKRSKCNMQESTATRGSAVGGRGGDGTSLCSSCTQPQTSSKAGS